ncbi:acyl-CoA dehydrogenase family protein [Micromonospora sp. CPCC 205539]|uniref:acyl-CoA dehydrogenase family protein n=1 Tax=Micromonospora sp. CPCC 205539 TaxID=3122408 RepID=UPI002FF20FE2
MTRGVDATQPWHLLQGLAREQGWQGALTRLHALAGSDVMVVGPGGQALVCPELARTAVGLHVGGTRLPRDRARERVLPVPVAGLVALRVRSEPPTAAAEWHPWTAAIAGLRLGLTYRLLDQAVAHLGRRSSGGVPLLHHQALQVSIADLAVEHLELGCVLDTAQGRLGATAAADLHRRITWVDRKLLHLFGAYGYEADGPAATGHVSELLADTYGLPRGEEVPA